MSVTVFLSFLRFFNLLLPLKLRCMLTPMMSLNNYQPGGILNMIGVDVLIRHNYSYCHNVSKIRFLPWSDLRYIIPTPGVDPMPRSSWPARIRLQVSVAFLPLVFVLKGKRDMEMDG